MQKTLLDEFAIAALNSTIISGGKFDICQYASASYDMAEAMMNEREKRMQKLPQQEDQNQSSDAEGVTSQGLSVEYLLSVSCQNAGKRMTATEIYRAAYGDAEKPSINELRDIGILMRQHGYQCKRIGGKDLFILGGA